MRLIFVSILLLLSTTLSGKLLSLHSGVDQYNMVPYSSFMVDESGQMSPQTVLSHRDAFHQGPDEIYAFGFTKKPVWIYFEINATDAAMQHSWILNVNNHHTDYYEFYRIEDGFAELIHEDGDTIVREKTYRVRTFWENLSIKPGTNAYLLKIQTKGSLQVPLLVQTLHHGYFFESYSNLLYGVFYGILLLLLIYNLVLFVVVKEMHYINYLLFLSVYMLFQLNFDGIGREWLWPENDWMVNNGMTFFIFLTSLFAFRFARYFLMLSRYSLIVERIVVMAEIISAVGALLSLVIDFYISIRIATAWAAISPLLLIYIGFYVLPTYRAARFYLAGWIVFLGATSVVALNKLDLIGYYPSILHMQQIGSMVQMMLLSFALADRINMMKIDHLKKLRAFNEKLQEKIARKVDELRQKDRMMIQQSRQAAMGEMIENIAHQWRQPLNQLALVQSSIFFDYSLGVLNEEKLRGYQEQSDKLMQYMTQTIDDFRTFFQPNKEKQPFALCQSIDTTLEMLNPMMERYHILIERQCDDTLNAYGHENEFSQVLVNILNNAKDAIVEREIKHPKIMIETSTRRESLLISISDNAGGIDAKIIEKVFDPYFTTKFQSRGTGIGLYMVKTIIEKNMDGQIKVENGESGAKFTIYLPMTPDKDVSIEITAET